jgi:uncharacterized protein DUF4384
MGPRTIYLALVIALFTLDAVPSIATPQGEGDVRGAFLTTRPKAGDQAANTTSGTRPARRRSKPAASNKTAPQSGESKTGAKASEGSKTKATAKAQRIGLGLTLFMRDPNGLAVRVDPSREFHKGDRVRVLLETNADGYLYIFNTTDGGEPGMIYPDPDLDEAGNFIQSHVPFEIPSSAPGEERLRWFSFDENAGTERLYFVFTREPLQGVPIEDELIGFCKQNRCPWRPSSEAWARVQKECGIPVQLAQTKTYGKAQSAAEHSATTRGIGLAKNDPEPSLILMNASSDTGMLITRLDLIHR